MVITMWTWPLLDHGPERRQRGGCCYDISYRVRVSEAARASKPTSERAKVVAYVSSG